MERQLLNPIKLRSLLKILCLSGFLLAFTSCRIEEGLSSQQRAELRYFLNMWQDLRQNFQLNNHINQPMVQKQIALLQQNKHDLLKFANNASPFLHYILKRLKYRKMPAEIALIPMLESNYNPFAYSKAGAVGLWQLMPGTANGFGLKHTWWYDERRDLIQSTLAALNYLEYLNKFFKGNWLYTIAAYNSGEGSVLNAIAKNRREGKSTDFWSLSLPTETKQYVAKLLALAAVIKNPKAHAVHLPVLVSKPYFDVVSIEAPASLIQLAEHAQLDIVTFCKLNAGFNHWTFISKEPRKILLPLENLKIFKKNYTLCTPQNHQTFEQYRVRKGDTLSTIAKEHQLPISILKEINQLSSEKLKIGQILEIPNSNHRTHYEQHAFSKHVKSMQNHLLGPQKIEYQVKPNDTLVTVAKRFNVKPTALEFWNQLPPNKPLVPGRKLVIWKPLKCSHMVKKGETLSHIAKQYQRSVADLKKRNHLKNNTIQVGQCLIV